MIIYLYNSNNELIQEYKNVISWGYNFVEFENGGRCKIYCRDDEYFTDKLIKGGEGNGEI